MTHRLRPLLPMLLLLLLLPLNALAESPASPLIGAEASADRGKRIMLLLESVQNDYDWSSSDKTIATVDQKGRVTGKKPGSCTITATHDDGTVYACLFTVTQPVTKVAIDKSSISLDKGSTYSLNPSIKPDDATDKTITYTSSDASVASVDEGGLVTALRAGKATITATAQSGKKDSIRITVTQPVTSLSLNTHALSVERGRRVPLTAAIDPADATDKKLTWTSSDKSVATVDSKGRVTGKKAGTCTITATAKSGVSVSCTIIVTQPVTKVAIDKSSLTLDKGLTYSIRPAVKPDDATDKTITYTSSDSSIASVDANGLVTALHAGKATITATAQSDKKDTIRITVTQPVTSLSLNAHEFSVERGKRVPLTASVEPADATNKKLTWTSSDKSVATVDSKGRVTGKKAGTCTITATAKSGASVSCTVTVTQPVTKVVIDKSSLTLDKGLTYSITPAVKPDDATDKTITYTSSDASVASVDEGGLVTALRAGKATITATAQSGKKDTIRITVAQPVTGLTLNASAFTIARGEKSTLAVQILPDDATNKKLTWTSSDKSVATVDSKGRVTGKKAGICTITATAKSSVSVSCTVTVTQPVTKLSIDPSRKTLSRNSTYALAPVVKPDNATDKTVFYQSSHPHIASVDENGIITAHADGKATITATAQSGKKDSIRITVESVAVKSVTLDNYYLTLLPGASAPLKASVLPVDASEPGIRYYSDNPAVASVDANGVITATGLGSAKITAVSADNSALTAVCCVYVRDPNAKGRLDGVIIGLNPGHQTRGDTTQVPLAPGSSKTGNKIGEGCTGVKTRAREYEVNLAIGLMLRDRLEAEGATVVITRTSNDVYITNIDRAKMLNEAGVHLALQLHCNSSATHNPNAKGIALYVKHDDQPSYRAAEVMIDQMVAHTGAVNAGIKKSNSYMSLNWSETPTILVEMGYMSNPEEDVLLSTPSYQAKLVEGMYEGIARYFGR